MATRKKAWYVVFVGRKTGIFNNWDECSLQVKGYSNHRQQGYVTVEEAVAAWYDYFKGCFEFPDIDQSGHILSNQQ